MKEKTQNQKSYYELNDSNKIFYTNHKNLYKYLKILLNHRQCLMSHGYVYHFQKNLCPLHPCPPPRQKKNLCCCVSTLWKKVAFIPQILTEHRFLSYVVASGEFITPEKFTALGSDSQILNLRIILSS